MAGTLDYVGIKRSLSEECNGPPLFIQVDCLFLKGANKLFADELAFLLRVNHVFEASQETLPGIDDHQGDMQVAAKSIDDLLSFACTQAAGIYKDAGQLIADGSMYKQSGYCRIDAAGESTDDPFVSHLPTNLFNGLLDHGTGSPGGFASTDTIEEIANDGFSLRSVADFGMELQAYHPLGVGDGRYRIALGTREHFETGG